ncbi:SRPBCC family protein [Arcanobacterium phocae]|uniref:SRPBCC family protein n=1 Tax=Arcanobacterium phocae TaxID=131112 RepID=UPI001C0EDF92|nr:SRPBCC domain-containing protein [Arcanobacterium phocae]
MTKIPSSLLTLQKLTQAAITEASHSQQSTLGVEHLFLALTTHEQIAGQVLRTYGITLETARHAVATQQADDLTSLGINLTPSTPSTHLPKTMNYSWSEPALEIIQRASKDKEREGTSALLHELVREPSGFIEQILHRFGTSAEQIIEHLDDFEHSTNADPHPKHSHEPRANHQLSATTESFIPAPLDQVWELLANPAHMPRWIPAVASVTSAPANLHVGASWEMQSPELATNRKIRQSPPHTIHAQLTAFTNQQTIEWQFSLPEIRRANQRVVHIELEPAAGGTQLFISIGYIPTSATRRRSALRRILRPLHRYVCLLQGQQISQSIIKELS